MKGVYPIIVLFLVSVALALILGFTTHKVNNNFQPPSFVTSAAGIDSFQVLVNSYYKLTYTKDSLQSLIALENLSIDGSNKIIAEQIVKQEELKNNKSKIVAKSLHKAKVTLTREDKRNLAIIDSILAKSEAEISNLRKKNVQSYKLIEQCLQAKIPNKLKLNSLLLSLAYYTSTIHGSREVIFQHVPYHIFVADLDSEELQMHLYNRDDKNKHFYTLEEVKKYLESEKRKPLMITNAGMYISSYDPQGLYVEYKSKTFFPINKEEARPNANFFLKPNGIFYLDSRNVPHIDSTEQLMHFTEVELRKFRAATQSGPMLVINGNIHKAFMPDSKNKKIRSGVGLVDGNNHKIIFAITMDETNFYDFALFFRDIFDCRNALFLDGAISQMYLPDIAPNELGGNFGPMISISRKKGK